MKSTVLYVVVPCYNEEEVIAETTRRLSIKLRTLIHDGSISDKSRILYVDDGSRDRTWDLIEKFFQSNLLVTGIRLSRNRGHQNAVYAGMMEAKDLCDCIISIDADLQDDIDVIDGFIEKYDDGCDIVYGVRAKRDTDSFFKRKSATAFYSMMNKMGAEVVYNHADTRLMSKRALEALALYPEVNLFLRGMVPTIGFKTDMVEYNRDKRFAGESKYPLKKMLALAMDGITSFSVKPIHLVTKLGVLVCIISICVLIYSLVVFLLGHTVSGWTSTMFSIWFLGGIQLICLGLIGEYIGKIYSEVKGRPRYFVDDSLLQ